MNWNYRPSVGIKRVAGCFVGLSLLLCWKYLPRYRYNVPLMQAIKAGNVKDVRELLDQGAEANAVGWPTTKSGLIYLLDRLDHSAYYTERNALMLAATEDKAEIVRLLLEHGAEVNVETSSKMTALECAASSAKPENVRLLLEYGAGKDQKQLASAFVETASADAMMHSDQAKYEECLLLLLQYGGNINSPDSYGNYALTLTAETADDSTTIRFLLQHGANPDVKDWSGYTPLKWAQEKNNSAGIQCLKKAGAKE